MVPAEIRRQFGLTPSDGLEWLVEGTAIRVVPVRRDPVAAAADLDHYAQQMERILSKRREAPPCAYKS